MEAKLSVVPEKTPLGKRRANYRVIDALQDEVDALEARLAKRSTWLTLSVSLAGLEFVALLVLLETMV